MEVVLSAQLAAGLQAAVNLETELPENRGDNKMRFNRIPINAAARRQFTYLVRQVQITG
jgi:hypothetical protein